MKNEKILLNQLLVDEFVKYNKDKVKELKKELIENENWLLCLGAGVSRSCKLPDWNQLLSKMMARTLTLYPVKKDKKEGNNKTENSEYEVFESISELLDRIPLEKKYLKNLRKAGYGEYSNILYGMDNLETAEYIKEFIEIFIKRDKEFKNDLYEDDFKGKLDIQKRNRYLAKMIQDCCKIDKLDKACKRHNGSTLEAVVHLMKNRGARNIQTALTYNYDNLLEEGLKTYAKVKEHNIISLVPEDRGKLTVTDRKQRKVFHIHGYIPVLNRKKEEPKGNIILTETSYYDEERHQYSIANVLQTYSMTHYNLLYIGFSGADYSFRRILRGMKKEEKNVKKYIFFCADDIIKGVINACHKNEIETEQDWEVVLRSMQETKDNTYMFEKVLINHLLWEKTMYWENHGLTVIWSTVDTLPDDLCGLVDLC